MLTLSRSGREVADHCWTSDAKVTYSVRISHVFMLHQGGKQQSALAFVANRRHLPNAPNTIFWRPGFVVASPGQLPPTVIASKAPMAMWHPEMMPMVKIFAAGIAAFFCPAATACWETNRNENAVHEAPYNVMLYSSRQDLHGFSKKPWTAAQRLRNGQYPR